jgi:hypothetical protein
LVTMLAFVAALVALGTSVVLFVLLVQEWGRWIVRRISEVTQRVVISRKSPALLEPLLTTRLVDGLAPPFRKRCLRRSVGSLRSQGSHCNRCRAKGRNGRIQITMWC